MIGRNVTIEVATTDLPSLRGTGDDVGRVSDLDRDRLEDTMKMIEWNGHHTIASLLCFQNDFSSRRTSF